MYLPSNCSFLSVMVPVPPCNPLVRMPSAFACTHIFMLTCPTMCCYSISSSPHTLPCSWVRHTSNLLHDRLFSTLQQILPLLRRDFAADCVRYGIIAASAWTQSIALDSSRNNPVCTQLTPSPMAAREASRASKRARSFLALGQATIRHDYAFIQLSPRE